MNIEKTLKWELLPALLYTVALIALSIPAAILSMKILNFTLATIG